MPSQEIIDNIRQENHPLLIYQAFGNNADSIPLAKRLIPFISLVYRNIEPEHFSGQLVIFNTLNDTEVIQINTGTNLYDKTVLTNNTSNVLVLQVFQDLSRLPVMWENVDSAVIFQNEQVLAYNYQNRRECFYANTQEIEINNPYNCASIYALQYQLLLDSIEAYHAEIRTSSCTIFQGCWGNDANRIFFINGPEDVMQESLKSHLSKSIRGVNVEREQNTGGSKPVDIRVTWREANRQALIEVKWLGKSKRESDGRISQPYSDRRANDGAHQLKGYLDQAIQDTPETIVKGYLLVIDGRRYRTNETTTTITRSNGMYYQNRKIVYKANRQYHNTMNNYEEPIRIFAEPICVD